jgi:hypothetical protein
MLPNGKVKACKVQWQPDKHKGNRWHVHVPIGNRDWKQEILFVVQIQSHLIERSVGIQFEIPTLLAILQ